MNNSKLRFSNNISLTENIPTSQRSLDISLTDPGQNSGASSSVTVNVNTAASPVATDATDVTQTSFTANWTVPTPVPDSYRLDVATAPDFSSYVSGYEDLDVGNTLNHTVTGLDRGIVYYYRLRAVINGVSGANSNITEVTTLPNNRSNRFWLPP